MTIAGFDPKWATFPDYIIGITKKIWEGRDIASLREYYAPDIIVRIRVPCGHFGRLRPGC